MANENKIILTPEEAAFIMMFRSMDEADQTHMLELAKGLLDGTLSEKGFREIVNRRE